MIDDIIAIKEVEWVKIQKKGNDAVLKVAYTNPHRSPVNWRDTAPRIILTSRKKSVIECTLDMIPKLVDRGLIQP